MWEMSAEGNVGGGAARIFSGGKWRSTDLNGLVRLLVQQEGFVSECPQRFDPQKRFAFKEIE